MSKPQHLNYCRQISLQFRTRTLPFVAKAREFYGKSITKETKSEVTDSMLGILDLSNASRKFMLPMGGRLLDDDDLRGLDGVGRLSLPFDFVALEYEASTEKRMFFADAQGYPGGGKQIYATARVLFCRHLSDDEIGITPVYRNDTNGVWVPWSTFAISRSMDQYSGIHVLSHQPDLAGSDGTMDCAAIVLAFMNALACSNVQVATSEPPKLKNQQAKLKRALPFDSYHILTIDCLSERALGGGSAGDGRSPREHLRRGHIRRLSDGRRLWINATVVNAGVGGKVSKDYAVKVIA